MHFPTKLVENVMGLIWLRGLGFAEVASELEIPVRLVRAIYEQTEAQR